jgi:hypothetical protein
MIIRYALALSTLALVLSAGPSYAGPCTQQILDVRDAAKQKMNAIAASGKTGKQSATATMHRQPTPNSIANAEVGLGEASGKDVEAFEQAMDEAYPFDSGSAICSV